MNTLFSLLRYDSAVRRLTEVFGRAAEQTMVYGAAGALKHAAAAASYDAAPRPLAVVTAAGA